MKVKKMGNRVKSMDKNASVKVLDGGQTERNITQKPNPKDLAYKVRKNFKRKYDPKMKSLFSSSIDNSMSEVDVLQTNNAPIVQKKKTRRKRFETVKTHIDKECSRKSKIVNAISKNFIKESQNIQKIRQISRNTQSNEVSLFGNSYKISSKNKKCKSLRERMMEKLKASRFRYLNEEIYTMNSKDAQKMFTDDPESFKAYHEGYRLQVNSWPINPVDVIISKIKKMSKNFIVADFGCGDAKLSREVDQKVHSFDLVATNELVTACDMAKVPMKKNTVDVVVFCLSLMGINIHDYLKEANRVLKIGGILMIAEVQSRFDDVDNFIAGVQRFGYQNTLKDSSHDLFNFMDFKKISNIKRSRKLPTLSLHPCLYKKR